MQDVALMPSCLLDRFHVSHALCWSFRSLPSAVVRLLSWCSSSLQWAFWFHPNGRLVWPPPKCLNFNSRPVAFTVSVPQLTARFFRAMWVFSNEPLFPASKWATDFFYFDDESLWDLALVLLGFLSSCGYLPIPTPSPNLAPARFPGLRFPPHSPIHTSRRDAMRGTPKATANLQVQAGPTTTTISTLRF